MKYGENLFSRRDVRPPAGDRPLSTVPPATAPSGGTPARPVPVAENAPVIDDPAGSKLIVGPNIKLKGVEIDDCDTLVVEGRVEATMNSRAIQIAERGAFHGKVEIDVAEVHGRFEGELTARKRLVIHATGRVSGKIRYGKVLVEEGGELTGEVASLTEAVPGTRGS
jgi:cytoskeletal protein CcmA (bactofilin family)